MIYSKCNTADSQHSDLSFQLNADSFPKQIHEQGKAFFYIVPQTHYDRCRLELLRGQNGLYLCQYLPVTSLLGH